MIEHTIGMLISDPHLPPDIARVALQELVDALEACDDAGTRARHLGNISAIFPQALSRSEYFLAGPRLQGPRPSIRVAQIRTLMSLEFMVDRSLIRQSGRDFSKGSSELIADLINNELSLGRARTGLRPDYATWVSTEDEILSSGVGEIQSGLALRYLAPGEPLFALCYDIQSDALHVPTMLDARYYRHFVSKPPDLQELPRAWNWENHRWGMSEIVHDPRAANSRPRLHYIGHTEVKAWQANSLASLKIGLTPGVEQVVAQLLRAVSAHRHLEPFLNGELDVLDLDDREFEQFVAHLQEREGYRTHLTRRSKDGGIDVITFDDLGTGEGMVIQAKASRRTVGIRVVRELVGARAFAKKRLNQDLSAHVLSIFTTGRFSQEALSAELDPPEPIALVDYAEIQRRLMEYRNVGRVDLVDKALASATGVRGNGLPWSTV